VVALLHGLVNLLVGNLSYRCSLTKNSLCFSFSLKRGSKDGDFCVVEVKRMQISHWSKRLHLGTSIMSLEFCPTERLVWILNW